MVNINEEYVQGQMLIIGGKTRKNKDKVNEERLKKGQEKK